MDTIIDFYEDKNVLGSLQIKNNSLIFEDNASFEFIRFVAYLRPNKEINLRAWAESLPNVVHGRVYAVRRETQDSK